MSVLLIGGDKVSSIKELLKTLGVDELTHWDSRKSSTSHKKIPKNTDLIVMLIDFLKHNSMHTFKKQAKKHNIPYLCTRRGIGSVSQDFTKFLEGGR